MLLSIANKVLSRLILDRLKCALDAKLREQINKQGLEMGGVAQTKLRHYA